MSELISVEDALALIAGNRVPTASETIALGDALGRTLAEPLVANVTLPPAAVSAMDGYAVRLGDVGEAGAALIVIGEAPAGTPFDTPVQRGEAVRIFTGGQLPPETDHVIPQERATRTGNEVTFENGYTAPAHVRPAGLDLKKGETILTPGTRIGPAQLAIIAAANHDKLTVLKRPKIALLANGDELRPPGSDLERGQIISSNPAALSALIRQWGGEPIDLGIAPDNLAIIKSFITRADEADIIVPVGGASVGDHDYMRTAFAELGYKTLFEKIAVKPGKPTWFASKDRQRVLGLPGNPASALVCAHLFLHALINPAQGHPLRVANLSEALPANGPRASYLRARVAISPNGMLTATAATKQDSSLLTPFLAANALIRRDAHAPTCAPGTLVEILLIAPI